MIYKALDYSLKENEERELSPPLEQLIDLMTNMTELNPDPCPDEGYEATEDEEEEELHQGSGIRCYRDVLKVQEWVIFIKNNPTLVKLDFITFVVCFLLII